MDTPAETEARALLADELRHVKSWLVDVALPLWAEAGFDRNTLLFEERLDFSCKPVETAPRRLLAQCRQLYVFSHASLLGWYDGRELVDVTLGSVLNAYGGQAAGVPYVASITRGGAIADARQHTYSYAFVLFALAWARKLLGGRVDPHLPKALIAHLKGPLAHADGQGFIDGLPRPDAYLRQNPHMHLLEACLELDVAFTNLGARELAQDMFRLFRERLFFKEAQALPELHDDAWVPVRRPDAVFEPGHHFEWMWLLRRYGAQYSEPVEDQVAELARRAFPEGIDAAGAAIEAVRIDGGGRTVSRRCWGTCEALKAIASDFEQKKGAAEATFRQAAHCLAALRTLFLSGPFAGGWTDRIDEHGTVLVDYVPSSTLYHIMLAIAEADRIFAPVVEAKQAEP